MNQLGCRLGAVSGCILRTSSRHQHQACRRATSAVVGGASQSLINHQQQMLSDGNHPITSTPIPMAFNNNMNLPHNNFSSLSFGFDAPNGLLDRANLEVVTPGHAIFFLQGYTAKYEGTEIMQSDFVQLCESARPGKLKDAKVISTALREFKRINKFTIDMVGASAAVEGMLLAMTPTWKVQDGKAKVRAAVYVIEQILDEKTGLYFAVDSEMVDRVLEQLHDGLLEMQKNEINVMLRRKPKDHIPDIETKVITDMSKDANIKILLKDSLRVTDKVVRLLLKRKSRPEWNMKKRKRKQYLKQLQFSGGPGRSTMKLATQISLLIAGSTFTRKNIIAPYDECWKTKTVGDDIMQLVEEMSALEAKEQLVKVPKSTVEKLVSQKVNE